MSCVTVQYSTQYSTVQVTSDEGVSTAGPGQLLTSFVYPEVGDPLGACQDGAGGVSGHVVPLTVAVQVVPERGRTSLGPERDPEVGEDGGPSLLHVRHVHQEGGNPVTCTQAGKCILFFSSGEIK